MMQRYPNLTANRYATVEDRNTIVLVGRPSEDTTEQLHFDRETGLLLRRSVSTAHRVLTAGGTNRLQRLPRRERREDAVHDPLRELERSAAGEVHRHQGQRADRRRQVRHASPAAGSGARERGVAALRIRGPRTSGRANQRTRTDCQYSPNMRCIVAPSACAAMASIRRIPRLDRREVLRRDAIAGVRWLSVPAAARTSDPRCGRCPSSCGHDEHALLERVLDAVALRAAGGACAGGGDDDALRALVRGALIRSPLAP